MRNNLDVSVTPGTADGGQEGGSPRGRLRAVAGGVLEKCVASGEPFSLQQLRAWFDREVIIWALEFTGGNITHAAALLGIARTSLHVLMRKLGVSRLEIKSGL